MSFVLRHARRAAAATLLAVLPLAPAQAQTVEAALERLQALAEEQGVTMEWASADISGSDAVLVDVTVGAGDETVPIGNVTLTGVSETDQGYLVESVAMDRYFLEEDGTSVTVEGVAISGLLLPEEGQAGAYGGFVFYDTADVGSILVNAMGKDVFTLTDLHVEVTKPEGESPLDFTGAAEAFTVDLSVVEDPQQKQILQTLGYEQLKGYFEMAGSWNPQDGLMELSQYDLSVVDAGTLGFSFAIDGYTPDFINSLREIQMKMAENPEGDNSAQGLAMMGLMQQLNFQGAEISFADDSLTGKVLELVAQMQGMKPDDIKNQAKAVLPFALAQLNNADFSAAVTAAVGKYLDNPESITISAAPAEPVPFAMLAAGAMTAPQQLPQQLGVTVTANEAE